MAVTYKLIETVRVGSGGAASITFSSIPQTYTDLMLLTSARSTSTGLAVVAKFNGSSANYTGKYLEGSGSSVASGTMSINQAGNSVASSYTASVFASNYLYIPNYTGSTFKSSSSDATTENNATVSYMAFYANLWSDTSAITSIALTVSAGSFAEFSSASLYGIKNS
jgi:hypothetical protein